MTQYRDAEDLKVVLEHAKQYFAENQNHLTKPQELLYALVAEIHSLICDGLNIQDCIFSYEDWYELEWGKPESAPKASRKIRTHIDKMENLLTGDSDLNQYLLSKGITANLVLVKFASSGGSKTQFTLNTDKPIRVPHKATENVVYKVVQFPKLYWWIKPFTQVLLSPTRYFLLVFGTIGLGFTALFCFWFFTGREGISFITWLALIMVIFAGILFQKVAELTNKGVAKAPDFLIPMKVANAFFVLSRDENNHLQTKLIVYEAKCGICGDKLIIENGGKQFSGRYVSKCAVNPSEHVFSFDHITKYGYYMHNNHKNLN